VNATVSPALASLLFQFVEGDFFRTAQARATAHERSCGLIADELPLTVKPDDVETLAAVRSRRCFAAAAT